MHSKRAMDLLARKLLSWTLCLHPVRCTIVHRCLLLHKAAATEAFRLQVVW